MEKISIAGAPEIYRGYMGRANEQGNKDEYLDGLAETEKAIKEMAEAEPTKLEGFLKYLEEKGKFDPCSILLLKDVSGFPPEVEKLCSADIQKLRHQKAEEIEMPQRASEASSIEIGHAPAHYQGYLRVGDESGNKDGKVNSVEASIAADLVCKQDRFIFKGFMDYLRNNGVYILFPLPGQTYLGACQVFEEPEPNFTETPKRDYSFENLENLIELQKRCKRGKVHDECKDVAGNTYWKYHGGEEKPIVEIDIGLAFGGGYYLIEPIKSKGWELIVNPNAGVDINLTQRVKAGYHAGWAYVSIDEKHALHSIDHQLGVSYDVLHYWPRGEERKSAIDLNLGGGVLMRNYFLTGEGNTRKSFNAGGFASLELGMLAGHGGGASGWTKVFLGMMATRGEDITDYSALLGIRYTFEVY